MSALALSCTAAPQAVQAFDSWHASSTSSCLMSSRASTRPSSLVAITLRTWLPATLLARSWRLVCLRMWVKRRRCASGMWRSTSSNPHFLARRSTMTRTWASRRECARTSQRTSQTRTSTSLATIPHTQGQGVQSKHTSKQEEHALRAAHFGRLLHDNVQPKGQRSRKQGGCLYALLPNWDSDPSLRSHTTHAPSAHLGPELVLAVLRPDQQALQDLGQEGQ